MGAHTVRNHLPILEEIIRKLDVKSAFEFGIGFHSTGLLLEKCETLYTVEMNDHRTEGKLWFDSVTEKFGERVGWTARNIPGKTAAIDHFLNLDRNFDLVFVDGHGDTRAEQANAALGRAGVIVVHDAQHEHTKRRLNSDDGYESLYLENFAERQIRAMGDLGPIPGIMVISRKGNGLLGRISDKREEMTKRMVP